MIKKTVEELKEELINIEDNFEIGKILYEKSLQCDNLDMFLDATEKVKIFLENITKHIESYINVCKDIYKNKNQNNFKYKTNKNEPIIESIIGYGKINVSKEDNKLKILLEAE